MFSLDLWSPPNSTASQILFSYRKLPLYLRFAQVGPKQKQIALLKSAGPSQHAPIFFRLLIISNGITNSPLPLLTHKRCHHSGSSPHHWPEAVHSEGTSRPLVFSRSTHSFTSLEFLELLVISLFKNGSHFDFCGGGDTLLILWSFFHAFILSFASRASSSTH